MIYSNSSNWILAWGVSLVFHTVLLGVLVETNEPSDAAPKLDEPAAVASAEAPSEPEDKPSLLDKAKAIKNRIDAAEQARPGVVPAAPEMPATPEPSAPAAETVSYTVKSGDNFTVIAKRYGLTNLELANLNGKPLKAFNGLRIGQLLKVPVTKGE